MLKIIRFRDVLIKCHSTRMYTKKLSIGNIGADPQEHTVNKMSRIRPSGQPPKVWQLIEKINKDGKLIKFTIQEIPEDRYEDAIQQMCLFILPEETMCHYLNAKDDPLFVQDISTLWRLLLVQGISVAAFTDNPNGGKPIIAAVNVLGVDVKNQKDSISDYQFTSKECKKEVELFLNEPKVAYKRYGVDKYLYALGLCVDADYRGYGLSKNLLKTRELIGSVYGIPATATVFSTIGSQTSAANAGFEDLLTRNFSDLVDKDGNEYFPGIKSKMFKVMGKRFS